MAASAVELDLRKKHCVSCEGGVEPLSKQRVQGLLSSLPEWKLARDGKSIRREWNVKDFSCGLDFLQEVGRVANREDHHPDLHLTGYRRVAIELSTHAVNGLTENDFILAAKIDAIPVSLKE
ncbi:MAG: 4a-hydroxytetrahydrobiopterin dehydratase [Planctomycetia bacterium]|nr:4a-hydroxytetrahydrobiopterin dehydratase [Planctomycetia bacterium]